MYHASWSTCWIVILLKSTHLISNRSIFAQHLLNFACSLERKGHFPLHYSDVIMGAMASQLTSLDIVYSTVYSGADQTNIIAPRHWPLCGEFTGDRWMPRTNASNAGNGSIWWRHHVEIWGLCLLLLASPERCVNRLRSTSLLGVGLGDLRNLLGWQPSWYRIIQKALFFTDKRKFWMNQVLIL